MPNWLQKAWGYLATVTSAEENAFITSLLPTTPAAHAWLGGSDAGAEGSWTWRTGPEAGQALTITNWATYQPDNARGLENYLEIWTEAYANSDPGTWNDTSNTNQVPYPVTAYVVEKSGTNTAPTASNGVMLAQSGSSKVFYRSDFGFNDVDGDSL